MGLIDDKKLAVCFKIELGLKYEYERNPALTDANCILGLENAKIAAKQQFGFARNESISSADSIQGIIQGCVALALARRENRQPSSGSSPVMAAAAHPGDSTV